MRGKGYNVGSVRWELRGGLNSCGGKLKSVRPWWPWVLVIKPQVQLQNTILFNKKIILSENLIILLELN